MISGSATASSATKTSCSTQTMNAFELRVFINSLFREEMSDDEPKRKSETKKNKIVAKEREKAIRAGGDD